jgi:hypothetical protein
MTTIVTNRKQPKPAPFEGQFWNEPPNNLVIERYRQQVNARQALIQKHFEGELALTSVRIAMLSPGNWILWRDFEEIFQLIVTDDTPTSTVLTPEFVQSIMSAIQEVVTNSMKPPQER